jgi:predicted site-specific integrase-resolvase
MDIYMKLSDWAKEKGISYRTAHRLFKKNNIEGAYQLPTGTIIVPLSSTQGIENVVIYVRVSSSENKSNLESQADRLVSFCMANGWTINKIIKEVGSGLNDGRPKLLKLLEKERPTKIVIEHKDRLTRFGFKFIEGWCNSINCKIVVVNKQDNSRDDLMQDFVSIITSFCARLYGLRRSKRQTLEIIKKATENHD